MSNLANSIEFYKKLELELAYQTDTLAFFWIEKLKFSTISWKDLIEKRGYFV